MVDVEVRAGALVEILWQGEPLRGVVEMVIVDECKCRGGDQVVIRFENGQQAALRYGQFMVIAAAPDRQQLPGRQEPPPAL